MPLTKWNANQIVDFMELFQKYTILWDTPGKYSNRYFKTRQTIVTYKRGQ